MNISIENIHKRTINPVWTSSHIHASVVSANMWPIRSQSRSRRFYTTPKTRKSHILESEFQPELAPVTLKVDVDQYNKQKSASSMAFCSTSKVKYMPLQGLSQDGLAALKWSGQCPGLFPVISRPTSRPIILHGKRYTTLPFEEERPYTRLSFNSKEEDKVSQKTENVSDQRRRFNEAERYKCNTKLYKENTEMSQFRIQRNYCLSGHKMFIKSSKETVEERLHRLQPILNLENTIKTKEENTNHQKVTLVEEDQSFQEVLPDGSKTEPIKTISHHDINKSIISVDIASGKKEEVESSSVSDAIKSNLAEVKKVSINSGLFEKSKQWLSECLLSHSKEITINLEDHVSEDLDETTYLWNLVLPRVVDVNEDVIPDKPQINIESPEDEDIEIFLTKIFNGHISPKEISYWSKILSLLKADTINANIFDNIYRLMRIFQCQADPEELSRESSMATVLFWVQLFSRIFNVKQVSSCKLSNFLEIIIKIIVNKNPLDDDSESCFEKMVLKFLQTLLQLDAEDNTSMEIAWTHIVSVIPWIFTTYNDIFHHSMGLDDFATGLTIVTNHFDT